MSQKQIERDAMHYATAAQKKALRQLAADNGQYVIHGRGSATNDIYVSDMMVTRRWTVRHDGEVVRD